MSTTTDEFRDRTIYLIGDYLRPHLAELIRAFLEERGAARVVLLTERYETAQEMLAAMRHYCEDGRLRALGTDGTIGESIARARAHFGDPHFVVSTPFRPLLRPWHTPAERQMSEAVAEQLTHHARVAQQLAEIEGVRLMVVTPGASVASAVEQAVCPMLGAFAGDQSGGVVRQIDLAYHTEEYESTAEAAAASLRRFITAVLGGGWEGERQLRAQHA
ncbi:MAG: hypothetical protein RLZZ387_4009 [Chloroflexota bacterium]